MNCANPNQTVRMNATSAVCPIGETTGKKNIAGSKIPVLSCEGACIRGEIARLAANIVSKNEPYGRGCHGELITVPDSAIARWIKTAEKVVLIDGCFLRCHGRIIENIIDEEKLIQFDALSHYNRYTDIFDYEEVPEKERKEVAQSVADWVLDSLESVPAGGAAATDPTAGQCGGPNDPGFGRLPVSSGGPGDEDRRDHEHSAAIPMARQHSVPTQQHNAASASKAES